MPESPEPLIIKGYIDNETGTLNEFIPIDGQPSKNEAIEAFIAGRNVLFSFTNELGEEQYAQLVNITDSTLKAIISTTYCVWM